MLRGGLENVTRPVDLGRHDLGRRIKGQSGGAMDDQIAACHRGSERIAIPDVALHRHDGCALRVIELGDVERYDRHPPGQQMANQIDPEKAGAAGDEHTATGHGAGS